MTLTVSFTSLPPAAFNSFSPAALTVSLTDAESLGFRPLKAVSARRLVFESTSETVPAQTPFVVAGQVTFTLTTPLLGTTSVAGTVMIITGGEMEFVPVGVVVVGRVDVLAGRRAGCRPGGGVPPSLSTIFPTPREGVERTAPCGLESWRKKTSSASEVESSTVAIEIVFDFSPAAKASVPDALE